MTARNDPNALTTFSDGCGVFTANGYGLADFASVVHGCNHHGLTVQIDTNVPHE